MSDRTAYEDALGEVVASARRLGVELNEADALQWLAAMTAIRGEEVVVDQRSGTFGHRVSLLDFSDEDLAHFRRVGRLVEFSDVAGQVETALALSGSAAQSKIQTYPGDADYFERVNIIAPTREEACRLLGVIMHQKVRDTFRGPDYQLIEVKLGNYPQAMIHRGREQRAGAPIAWTGDEAMAGCIEGTTPDGDPVRVTWDEAARDPGWCKIDWVVADVPRQRLANASNMLDVTWEAPDGSITPLDGYLDSYFQEVYLDAASIPVFGKLVKHVSGDALDHYVRQLENEVRKYVGDHPNYGKAAKRMYNIFRLTGQYPEAAYLRELFDEPTTMLYQVGTLIRTVEESFQPGSDIDTATIVGQTDRLILAVIQSLEGEREAELTRQLLHLRGLLAEDAWRGHLSPQVSAAQAEIANIVNNFFYEKLTGVPTILRFIEEMREGT